MFIYGLNKTIFSEKYDVNPESIVEYRTNTVLSFRNYCILILNSATADYKMAFYCTFITPFYTAIISAESTRLTSNKLLVACRPQANDASSIPQSVSQDIQQQQQKRF